MVRQVCIGWLAIGLLAQVASAQISQADPDDFYGGTVEDFSTSLIGEISGLLTFPEVVIGERFQGQTVDLTGSTDVLTGAPSAPLTVLAGPDGQNLFVYNDPESAALNNVIPVGEEGNGRGTMAFLFDDDQSHVAFLVNVNAAGVTGPIFVDFYDRSGTNLGDFTLNLSSVPTFPR